MNLRQLLVSIKLYVKVFLLSIGWAVAFVLASASVIAYQSPSVPWQAFWITNFIIGLMAFAIASATVKFVNENWEWLFGKRKEATTA